MKGKYVRVPFSVEELKKLGYSGGFEKRRDAANWARQNIAKLPPMTRQSTGLKSQIIGELIKKGIRVPDKVKTKDLLKIVWEKAK